MCIRRCSTAKRGAKTDVRLATVGRRAFTLIESLMATGLLLVVVVAVSTAITAGQQQAYEAHQRIAASLAAEELMGRISTENYASLPTWNGHTENVGQLTNMDGTAATSSLQMVGRDVRVVVGLKALNGLDVRVRGATITVRSFNNQGRTLATVTRFVPEPQS